ncbi:hypothetical protein SME17J_47330 (plasmid) [Serratia marcescens]|nr:hypothetical protein SME17J_47330 [Serratia marcescens]
MLRKLELFGVLLLISFSSSAEIVGLSVIDRLENNRVYSTTTLVDVQPNPLPPPGDNLRAAPYVCRLDNPNNGSCLTNYGEEAICTTIPCTWTGLSQNYVGRYLGRGMSASFRQPPLPALGLAQRSFVPPWFPWRRLYSPQHATIYHHLTLNARSNPRTYLLITGPSRKSRGRVPLRPLPSCATGPVLLPLISRHRGSP